MAHKLAALGIVSVLDDADLDPARLAERMRAAMSHTRQSSTLDVGGVWPDLAVVVAVGQIGATRLQARPPPGPRRPTRRTRATRPLRRLQYAAIAAMV